MQGPKGIIRIVDTHADSLGDVLKGRRHLDQWAQAGQLDFPRMRSIGHTLQFLSCWVEPEYKPERALPRLLQYIDAYDQELKRDGQVIPVTDQSSLSKLLRTPEAIGVVLSVEGAEALGTDTRLLRVLWRLGVRLLSLTWNERNALADGAGEDPGGGGVSRAGREMIREMNRIGMILDVSHLAETAFWDALEISQQPVIASHSNCRSLASHRRNLSNAQILALSRQQGIQSITFVRDFLGPRQDLAGVVAHVLHHLDIVGDDQHLGIGSDFDGVEDPVPGLEDVTRLPAFAEALAAAGLGDATIARILGHNYLEFLGRVWSGTDEEGVS